MSSAVEGIVDIVDTQDKQLQDGDVLNGNIDGMLGEEEGSTFVKDGRIIRKAKRIGKGLAQLKGRRSSEEKEHENVDGNTNNTIAVRAAPPFSKNSRKSRSAKGRGLPKKGKRSANMSSVVYFTHR